MAGSTSAEVWLDQRRWDALEEALKAQGSDIEQHLQDYLISLYNEMVPQEQWEQVEKRISNEAAETAREAEEHTVYTVFHVREHGHDSIFSTGNGEEFLDVAIRLRRYLWGGKTVVFSPLRGSGLMNWPSYASKIPARSQVRLKSIWMPDGSLVCALRTVGRPFRSKMFQPPLTTPHAVPVCHWKTGGKSLSTAWMEIKSNRRALPLLRSGAYVPWRREIYSVLTDLFSQTGS